MASTNGRDGPLDLALVIAATVIIPALRAIRYLVREHR